MNLLKDDPELQSIALELAQPLPVPTQANPNQRAVAAVYNRLGGLLQQVAEKTETDAAGVAAVWLVESGGLPFVPKRAVIRLEVSQLFEVWGKRDREVFDNHFRFGGHNQQPGNPWDNQEYRTQDSGNYSSVHHNQNSEYGALTLAQVIAGDEVAFSCASIGGCQIMMNAYRMLGYETAREMYDAFQLSERTQVLSFFDFCRQKPAPKLGDLLQYLKARDWNNFARFYNGTGQVPAYAAKLKAGYDSMKTLLNVPRAA
ncbi:MAG: N-acetylmuramidase domain-containing protein [Bryobacteraceae bacterium]